MEVLECQGKSLADPDSRGVQKAKKRPVGVRPQRLGRRQCQSRREQGLDFLFIEDVRTKCLLSGNALHGFGHMATRVCLGDVLA